MLDPPIELSFEDQFAFRPAGSCTAAIIALLHTVSTMLLENPYVIVIALDFSKAFDTVRHSALAKKLSILDMPDSVYNWMVDFLVQHEHCTVFEKNVSSTVRVNSSVIQGSVIGPGSYDVAASDLHPVVDGNKLVKFADDLTLIIPARNLETRQSELNNIQSWSNENNLQLNCKKSQEMIISRPRTRQIQDIPELPDIRRVMSVKLLGVTLTGQFSMELHISEVISSSARALYALRILRTHGMKDADLQTVFRATALSKLLYASPSWWGFTSADQRNRLEGFLRKATRARFYPEGSPTFSKLCEAADVALSNRIVTNVHHPLQGFLPPRLSRPYNMRPREHEFQLPDKQNSIHERNFLIRIFYLS